MSIDEAKQLALDHATHYKLRCYVVCIGDECQAATLDEIKCRGLAMAQSPSPVVGYYDATAAAVDNFISLNQQPR